MRILLLGGGGREHALAWKLAQSPRCEKLFIAPGNPGTARCGTNVSLRADDKDGITAFCRSENIDMVVVGPEDPLVQGITDHLRKQADLGHLILCGPGASGARLEGSKAFAKAFMSRWNIPTAAYGRFEATEEEAAIHHLRAMRPPYVIKADGLAAGKGVIISSDASEAEHTVRGMFSGQFGDAGQTIVLEEFLDGIEFSVFVLTDGHHYRLLPVAKDYKRVGEGDQGPNTGGMGAVSPVPFVDTVLMDKVRTRIVEPTLKGLQEEGIPYQGFIFFGLIRVDGQPYVIEYNCRMGDPETEVVMPRLESDLVGLIEAMGRGTLGTHSVQESPQHAVTVMLVSQGYPGDYPKGRRIEGLDSVSDALVFQAGTREATEGIVTSGGRVAACTALGGDLQEAIGNAYALAGKIHFEGAHYRKDIGKDLA